MRKYVGVFLLLLVCIYTEGQHNVYGNQVVHGTAEFRKNIYVKDSIRLGNQWIRHIAGDSIPDFNWVRENGGATLVDSLYVVSVGGGRNYIKFNISEEYKGFHDSPGNMRYSYANPANDTTMYYNHSLEGGFYTYNQKGGNVSYIEQALGYIGSSSPRFYVEGSSEESGEYENYTFTMESNQIFLENGYSVSEGLQSTSTSLTMGINAFNINGYSDIAGSVFSSDLTIDTSGFNVSVSDGVSDIFITNTIGDELGLSSFQAGGSTYTSTVEDYFGLELGALAFSAYGERFTPESVPLGAYTMNVTVEGLELDFTDASSEGGFLYLSKTALRVGLGVLDAFRVMPHGVKSPQLSGSLTDGAPTNAEITAIIGYAANNSLFTNAGFRVTIKDTDGTGLLYQVESDGTSWFYTVMTEAL